MTTYCKCADLDNDMNLMTNQSILIKKSEKSQLLNNPQEINCSRINIRAVWSFNTLVSCDFSSQKLPLKLSVLIILLYDSLGLV